MLGENTATPAVFKATELTVAICTSLGNNLLDLYVSILSEDTSATAKPAGKAHKIEIIVFLNSFIFLITKV